MTIDEALRQATKKLRPYSDSPRLDAEVLLGYILKQNRASLLVNGHQTLDSVQTRRLRTLLLQRANRIPIPYLTGTTEFFGLPFCVTPSVLVPRPFTELLVGELVSQLKTYNLNLTIADIGTGSGAIACVLAKHLSRSSVIATDISPAALAVAKKNVTRLGLIKQITLRRGSLLAALKKGDGLNIVVANLPYLTAEQLREPSISQEPKLALYGGSKGLTLIRQLLVQAKKNPSITMIALEFDPPQLQSIRHFVKVWSPTATIVTIGDGRKVRGLVARR